MSDLSLEESIKWLHNNKAYVAFMRDSVNLMILETSRSYWGDTLQEAVVLAKKDMEKKS
jgi:hypothetical protein